jgi:hypothetical protein
MGEKHMSSALTPNAAPSTPSRRSILLTAGATVAAIGLAKTAGAAVLGELGTQPLSANIFASLVGSYFIVSDGDARPQLQLVDVVLHDRGQRPEALPDPFSLIFSSPWNEKLATQVYEVENQSIGHIAMFITPVAQNVYEAPFN